MIFQKMQVTLLNLTLCSYKMSNIFRHFITWLLKAETVAVWQVFEHTLLANLPFLPDNIYLLLMFFLLYKLCLVFNAQKISELQTRLKPTTI